MATNFPTTFDGNVRIKTNVQPLVHGDGSLQVDGDTVLKGNLTVEGMQSNHLVETFVVQDNVIAIGEPPTASGKDGGMLISRHIDDTTSGPAAESGTAQAGAATTITLDPTANVTAGFYNSYFIKITGGPGIGEKKEITSYTGATQVATVDSAWTTTPTAASTYELYNKPHVGFIFDESADEAAIIATVDDHTMSPLTINDYCNLHVGKIIQEIGQECIFYVGQHGVDTDSGQNINEAKLTFGAALTAAAATTPSANNQIVIVCNDACEYTENLTIASWIHVRAPHARLEGTITIGNNASVHFRDQEISSGTAITKTAANGYAIVKIDTMTLTGTADGVSNSGAGGQLKFINNRIDVEDGIAVINSASATGYLDATLCDIFIAGTGTALQNSGTTLNVMAHQILENGGTGTAIDLNSGTLNAYINKIDVTAACDLAVGTTLNLYAGEISGTETDAGATNNKLPAVDVRSHIDDVTTNPHSVTINQANTAESLLTTKGDLFVRNATDVIRLAVGADTQVLTADSSEASGVKWVNPTGSAMASYTMIPNELVVNVIAWTGVAKFPWLDSRHNGYSSGTVVFRVDIGNRDLDIRLRDITNGTTLGSSLGISASGSTSFVVSNPPGDAELELQVRKSMGGGINPDILGCVLEYDI